MHASRLRRLLIHCAYVLGALSLTSPAWSGNVQVAVAANFAAPLKLLSADFEKATGHTLAFSAGSTGKLYAQIRNGAPMDVFLSADDETPARLEQDGSAVAGTRLTYAVGRLVLWSATPGLVDAQGAVLQKNRFKTLAIAAPKLAPYGAAALQVLDVLGLTAAVAPKLVQGESIGQVYSFVATGNADLGFVALSQVWADGRWRSASGWVVPAHLHSPLRQDAVLLSHGRDNAAAKAFLAYLQTSPARALIRRHGYEVAL